MKGGPLESTQPAVYEDRLSLMLDDGKVPEFGRHPASRTNPADWRTVKPSAELGKIKAAGGFLDLIQPATTGRSAAGRMASGPWSSCVPWSDERLRVVRQDARHDASIRAVKLR